ncbi:hypothetical protein [Leuconostoc carnosum]|uniref:hypothetical protein n=1 Tax=Leuconostoc carnosum TaxID=1252 RepID=UPI0037BFC438
MLSGILLLLWIVTSIVFLVMLVIFIVEKQRKKQGSINKTSLIVTFAIGLIFLIVGMAATNLNEDSHSASTKTKTVKKQTIYKVEVDNVKVDDTSNWEIKGTTNAPDGAKMFAIYGDETDNDFFGTNAASSTSDMSWSIVKNGQFAMSVNPLTMHYEETYQANKTFKAYLFAVTGLKGKLKHYSIESKISSSLKSNITDNIKTTNLTLSESQAKYYNDLSSSSYDEDDSDSDSEEISSDETSEKDPNSFKTGITYEQIARTPDDHEGKKIQFTGKVIQVLEDDDETQIRLAVDGNSDNIILVDIDQDILKGSRILEDDLVTASGESDGTTSYDSTMGGKITIPAMSAEIIDNQGKANDDYGY